MWSFISQLHSHVVPYQSLAQTYGALSVICTVEWCRISCVYSPRLFYQAHAWTCGALSVICTLLPLVLNPAFLLAGLFANQGRESIVDLILPLPSAVAFRL